MMGRVLALLAFLSIVLCTSLAWADDDDARCKGPEACCPASVAPSSVGHVRVGAVLLGLANVSDKSGTWEADFYLYETWTPSPGFTPATEIVNLVERKSTSFDETVLRDGKCERSRRIYAVLRSEFNLRRFPFDEQKLTLELSDDSMDLGQLVYDDAARPRALDRSLSTMVSGWRVVSDLGFERSPRKLEWADGTPTYDYATFSVAVRRHIAFHLTRYFLPLILIVVVAFTVFWIDSDDLGSQVGIGVTCLLAAIALQFAEGGTLPEVSYLTFADRVYACCYTGIAAAMIESVWVNALSRAGKKDQAMRLDRRCRVIFPVMLVVALLVSGGLAFS
jgi:hypothetical protein